MAPTGPVFPQVPHLIGLALAGGILLGFALIIRPELAGAVKHSHPNRAVEVEESDLVDLLVARRRKEASKDLQSARP
jgi:hypothetical protein